MAAVIVTSAGGVEHVKQGLVEGTCDAVAGFFDGLPPFDAVVLERQPGANVRMCRLQHYIEMLYHARNVPVHVFDPRKRLEFCAKSSWWPPKTPFPKTYYTRKQSAVRTCRIFLEATGQTVHQFEVAAKKDDIADAIMQAMAYFDSLGVVLDSRDGLQAPV